MLKAWDGPFAEHIFFSDQQHVTPCLRLLTIHRDGSLSLINHNEINRPVLLLCLGFDHAIHLTFY